MKRYLYIFFLCIFLLSACGKPVPTATPTQTSVPATATALPPTATPSPTPTQDPAIFGAIGTSEIQAFALESVVNAIFKKTMDGFAVTGQIQAYQITSVSVFPGSAGLLTEVIYNVKSDDPAWLTDGGTQTTDGWINGNCSRFDFVTTETEYQLKNRRLCG